MNRNDFIQMLWVAPFLGGFIAFIIASIMHPGEAATGIMIMLGALAGSITLLTYVLSIRYVNCRENDNKEHSTKA